MIENLIELKDFSLLIDEVKGLKKELSTFNEIMKDIRNELHSLNMKMK